MAALTSSMVWFLFIALTIVVVVGYPTMDLLEAVDSHLGYCERYFSNADRSMAENLIVRLQVATDSVRGLLDSLHYSRRISCLTSIQGIEQSTN